MSEDKPKLKSALKKIKIEYLIVAVLAIVAFFITLNAFGGENVSSVSGIDKYVNTLETKLKKSLSKVNNAGKVEVIISVESGMNQVLATEKTVETAGGAVTESPIMVGGKPVVLKEAYPQIVGVVIVAEGANNLTVKVSLLNAAAVFLNIPTEKIEILAMK